MFCRYTRERVDQSATRYKHKEEVSLFGCNEGFIAMLLKNKLPKNQDEVYKWHIDFIAELGAHPDYPCSTLLIDLKPWQKEENLSLYEVMDAWGYSADGWTPIMLRLNGLFVDADPSIVNRDNFVCKDDEIDGPIHEFMYVNGSVKGGKLSDNWTLPGPSPTNGVLLWPDTLNYFFECIRASTPEVLQRQKT